MSNQTRDVDVLVVATSGDIQDLVLSAVAAQELQAKLARNIDEVQELWPRAQTVFVAEDLAEALVGRALPRREQVYLVGADEGILATWSTPLGAKVIALPDGIAWLGAVLAENVENSGAPVLTLLGGSGGVGVSTLAATLALTAAKSGPTALVDVDPLGGGIDLLLGVERTEGWRWPRLRAAEGHVGDLREYLPRTEGVSIVSMARDAPADLAKEPLAAIVNALRRTHRLVVLDAGRGLSSGSIQAVQLASRRIALVWGNVRGIAAADQVIKAHGCKVEVVLRSLPGGVTDLAAVKELLKSPVIATLPNDKTLAMAADRGELAWLSARRSYVRTCAQLVASTRAVA